MAFHRLVVALDDVVFSRAGVLDVVFIIVVVAGVVAGVAANDAGVARARIDGTGSGSNGAPGAEDEPDDAMTDLDGEIGS